MSQVNQYIIGLSGHIDHGKTSLVKNLTGKNTDSLKEEINRGMTINIGFAFINEQITLIDVPGHEKFIKNMVSGVSAIDYALLVIAADDGIMPQTIEHFEILKLLNVKKGMIVLTKIDLVDSDWIDLVESDIKNFVKGSFLDGQKIQKISSITGQGIKELKEHIINLDKCKKNDSSNIFRLFVDRVFVSHGFGTVVTGTVLSGDVSIGEELKILPKYKKVKVRGLQTHDENVKKLYYGDRGAINFQSLDKIDIKRGYHISHKDYFDCYESAIVSIQLLSSKNIKIRNNERLRIYLGTQEVMARILIPDNKFISSDQKVGALLKFEKTIVISWNDTFIIRTYSPLVTIGGGTILDVGSFSKWKDNCEYINKLFNTNNKYDLIEKIIESKNKVPFTFNGLSNYLNISENILNVYLDKINNIIYINDNWILSLTQFSNLKSSLIYLIENFHNKNPYRHGILKEEIITKNNFDLKFLEHFLKYLINDNILKISNSFISLKNYKVVLSSEDLENSNEILSVISQRDFNSISIEDLMKIVNIEEKKVKKILNFLIGNKELILIDSNYLFSSNNINKLVSIIRNHFINNQIMDVKTFKNLTNTTRKLAVPLLEYLDKIGLTYRDANVRRINEK